MTQTSQNTDVGKNIGTQDGFSIRAIALIIAVSVMSFGGLATLLAWGPELRDKDIAGAHVYSSSALGYAGLIKMLERQGTPVQVSRTDFKQLNPSGLTIMVPDRYSVKFGEYVPISSPALIILPKWNGLGDRLKPKWQKTTFLAADTAAQSVLKEFDKDATVKRGPPPAWVTTPGGALFKASFDKSLQVMKSKSLEPMLTTSNGILLAKVPDFSVYILTDPDLANNFGISDPENARLMLSIIATIRGDQNRPVVFDATLNGFERSTNLLRIILDIPFLGATLTILAGFLLLGWSACVRFGAPERDDAVFTLGKQALADNTAALLTMTNREAHMAPGYLALSRKAARKALGAPPHLTEAQINDLLERLSKDDGNEPRWKDISASMSTTANSREDLILNAQRLYRWREEKTHGHK